MIDPKPVLTDAGREYAAAGLPFSLISRVALLGYNSPAGWPDTHVSAAIKLCNEQGEEKSRD